MRKYSSSVCRMVICLLVICFLAGCGKINKDTRIVLTAGFTEEEVFRIGKASCTKPEIMVYLTNIQNLYEQVYGPEIWEKGTEEMTLEENVKETVLSQIAQIKIMNLMAEQYQVTLDKDEKSKVNELAEKYFSSLSKKEKELMGVNRGLIEELYTEYAIAGKVYNYIIKDVNPEISDDEARIITVEQMSFRTYITSEDGTRKDFSEEEKQLVYRRAGEALSEIQKGESSFEALVEQYSDDTQSTYNYRKGETDPIFEKYAFDLGKDEVSGIIETPDGYFILKCTNTFDRTETETNKKSILENRKKQTFSEEYDSFVQTLTRNINDKIWEEITFIHDPEVKTSDFFDNYDSTFE